MLVVRCFALVLLIRCLSYASPPGWLELVEPIITPPERKAYLALGPAERSQFAVEFWAGKAIGAGEYYQRLEVIDSKFGSSKRGSGANTDPGRVWLSLGPPTRVKRLPSSRIFVPLEIWYYDTIPGVLNTELRLIFYQPNSIGLPRLYSPALDTIRTLLIPQAATRGMFGPNSVITESDIRKQLRTRPAEDEVITAAVNIAPGITGAGNNEILAQIASPRRMLRRELSASVKSRLIVARPPLDILETASPYGGVQVDLRLATSAQKDIVIEVLADSTPIYRNLLHLGYSQSQPVEYLHRLDLLPGSYRILFTIDGAPYVYALDAGLQNMRDVFRFEAMEAGAGRVTPFEFNGRRVDMNPGGRYAGIALSRAGTVQWMIRRGREVIWRASSRGESIAEIELPAPVLRPGSYRLEAVGEEDSRSVDLNVGREGLAVTAATGLTILSFNANLTAARRLAFIGRQWLLRGDVEQARRILKKSLSKEATEEAHIGLAQADALAGNLDAARDQVREVLATHPDSFEALSVLAYIEARFEDYPAAANLYRRALSIQDSPPLREALAKLPVQ